MKFIHNKWSYGTWFFTLFSFVNAGFSFAGIDLFPWFVNFIVTVMFAYCIYREYKDRNGGDPPKWEKKAKAKLKTVKDMAARKIQEWGATPGLQGV